MTFSTGEEATYEQNCVVSENTWTKNMDFLWFMINPDHFRLKKKKYIILFKRNERKEGIMAMKSKDSI